MELKGLKINFLGDSITEGHGASSFDVGFVSQIQRLTGAICRNYGIGGTRYAHQHTPSANPRYDLDFCQRVEEMDPDADVVVIFGGTNDFGHGDAPLGCMDDRTGDTFYGALHEVYTKALHRYPEALIVVLTPTHRKSELTATGDPGRTVEYGTLKEYVNIIREVAQYYSLPVLDLYACSGIQPNDPVMREKYMPDMLHPNDAGHLKLAHTIIRFLENTL